MSSGYYVYSITCDAPSYETLSDYDSIGIASSAVPEFSNKTLVLALLITIVGLFFVIKRKSK